MEENTQRHHIHWFPGHMMRTIRVIEKKLPMVDAVVQLLDARIPRSSLNPDLQKLYGNKPCLYLLNKSDLADKFMTAQWLAYFKEQGYGCVVVNSRQKGAAAKAKAALDEGLAELFERRKVRGMAGAKTRLMVTGIPNVGKSTFINNWAGSAATKVADKPGVTRGEQWIKAGAYELMDMPGVLWKRFDDNRVAVNLALIGSIPDHLLDTEQIAAGLLGEVAELFPEKLTERYKLENPGGIGDDWGLLEAVGRRRGMLISGGEVDTQRAAIMVLDEFREGRLGRITLESVIKTEK